MNGAASQSLTGRAAEVGAILGKRLASRLAAGQRTLTPLTVVRIHPRHFERFELHEMFAVAAANVIKQPVYRSMTAAPSLAVPRATKHTVFANFRSFVGET